MSELFGGDVAKAVNRMSWLLDAGFCLIAIDLALYDAENELMLTLLSFQCSQSSQHTRTPCRSLQVHRSHRTNNRNKLGIYMLLEFVGGGDLFDKIGMLTSIYWKGTCQELIFHLGNSS
jgi:hypothetical protein